MVVIDIESRIEYMGKILNNKVVFWGGGNEVIVRLSDDELAKLRRYSIHYGGDDISKKCMMEIYNFSLYTYIDDELKRSSKGSRIKCVFPYLEYDSVWWNLL